MKRLLALLALPIVLAATTAAAAPVFRNVSVTDAAGGVLTGAPGNPEKVTVKELSFAGSMFEGKVDGETWLFNPDLCAFTLANGDRLKVVRLETPAGEKTVVGLVPAN